MTAGNGSFDYPSLKQLLKETNAEVLLPGDGEAYEKSIERWSEHCIKRAVSIFIHALVQYLWSIWALSRKYKLGRNESDEIMWKLSFLSPPFVGVCDCVRGLYTNDMSGCCCNGRLCR